MDTAQTVHPAKDNGSGIQVTIKTGRSLSMLVLHKILRPIRSFLLKAPDPVSGDSQKVKIPNKVKREYNVDERQVEGHWICDITAKSSTPTSLPATSQVEKQHRKRVYYFCGGGWSMPPSAEHVYLCSALAARMPDTTVSIVSYKLAPESPAPISFPQMCRVYKTLLESSAQANETVILAGDSAGGNIVLSLPWYVLSEDPQARAPAAIMAISPSTDLRRSNPAIQQVAKHDPILTPSFIKSTADGWRADWDAFDPRVSPLAADVKIFAERNVAVHGAFGTYDVLYPDAKLFRDKLAEAGVNGKWLEWEEQMHVWVLTARFGLRDAKTGVNWIADVMNGV